MILEFIVINAAILNGIVIYFVFGKSIKDNLLVKIKRIIIIKRRGLKVKKNVLLVSK